ncbi:hypothetical protein I3842_15G126700 [Carya illinoinensis]|uniref:Uncharacterized protein n=1 Tax=Carya illinoinensis TaxID=32201 RepID=A0A922D2B7_CARIL|nr:hypothetical protein I3842_15G126700 [Carya illinoinensis]
MRNTTSTQIFYRIINYRLRVCDQVWRETLSTVKPLVIVDCSFSFICLCTNLHQ